MFISQAWHSFEALAKTSRVGQLESDQGEFPWQRPGVANPDSRSNSRQRISGKISQILDRIESLRCSDAYSIWQLESRRSPSLG
jgi:hypothetical protein